MSGQPVEHFPFCVIGCEVPDKGGLGRVSAKFFEAGLIVIHRKPQAPNGPGLFGGK